MALMQGNGKVRLIAKKGRYQEDANSKRLRGLVAAGADPSILTDAQRGYEMLYGEGVTKDDVLSNYYIEFDVTPDITESGSVSYFEAGEIRGPSSILMYMGSPSRNFSVNAKLVARNAHEARKVASQIHILKSWRMPESYTGGIDAGTPTLLYLQGYGKMFKDIPVVMTDLSIEFSSEHDFIAAGSQHLGNVELESYTEQLKDSDGNRFLDKDGKFIMRTGKRVSNITVKKYDSAVPIIVPVSFTLKEAHSTEGDLDGLETFDILKYRTGNLVGW